jgi:hypothetical protein
MLPFKENSKGNISVRTFSNSVNETELKWHWDNENRIVVCEHETDWQIQMDNQLPFKIEKNKKYFIPEGEYHRVIKGSGDLTIKVKKLIKEYDDEDGYTAIRGHFSDQEDKHDFVLIYSDTGWDMGIVKNKSTNETFLVDYNFIDSDYETDWYYKTNQYDDLDLTYSYEPADNPELQSEGVELFVKHAVEENKERGNGANLTNNVEEFGEQCGVLKITDDNKKYTLKKFKQFFIEFYENKK